MAEERRVDVCVTCADELIPVRLEWVSQDGLMATGRHDSGSCDVALDLLDGARVGDLVLVHGGVALQHASRSRDKRDREDCGR